MAEDDEFEALMLRARATLDDDAIAAMFERAALSALKEQGQPVPGHPGGTRTTMSALQDAVAAELRRLLTKH